MPNDLQTPDVLTLQHPWTVPDAAALSAWVDAALARHEERLNALTGSLGERSLETTLRPYDDAVALLSAAGSQLSLLNSVHPDKSIRDTAQAEIEKISQAAVALSLNREVYAALSQVPQADDAATRHYIDRTLLGYRLAGVDRDDATREKLRALQERATVLSLNFARNVQEGAGTVVVESSNELRLPGDSYIRAAIAQRLPTNVPPVQPHCEQASRSGKT